LDSNLIITKWITVAFKKTVLLTAIFACLFLFITIAASASSGSGGQGAIATHHNVNPVTIQVSSFRKAQDSNRQVAILRACGLDAVSSYEAVKGKGMWNRVYVGRYSTRQEAGKVASRLKARGIISGYWVKVLKTPEVLAVSSETTPVGRDSTEHNALPRQKSPQVHPNKSNISPAGPPDRTGPVNSQAIGKPETTTTLQVSEAETERPVETSRQAPTPEFESNNEGLFSIALRFGGVYFPEPGDFKISGPTGTWYFNEKYLTGAIVPSFRLNESLFLESSLEKILNAKFDFWYVTLGPKLRLASLRRYAPFIDSLYIKGALAWGDMSWDDVPGRFDSSFGWEAGIGIISLPIRPDLKLGLEASYRSIEFDYNAPFGRGVKSNRSSIDFSGFSFTGSLMLLF